VVVNKTDMAEADAVVRIKELTDEQDGIPVVCMSALSDNEYDELRTTLSSQAGLPKLDNMVVVANARHYESLRNVEEAMKRVITGLDENVPTDLIAIDVRQAIHYLGEITGEISTDEILGNIFRNFCIGK
jgi:tRNA modification GTPase